MQNMYTKKNILLYIQILNLLMHSYTVSIQQLIS